MLVTLNCLSFAFGCSHFFKIITSCFAASKALILFFAPDITHFPVLNNKIVIPLIFTIKAFNAD